MVNSLGKLFFIKVERYAVSSETSPTFGHANANLNIIIHFFRNRFLIRSINTEKFAFA